MAKSNKKWSDIVRESIPDVAKQGPIQKRNYQANPVAQRAHQAAQNGEGQAAEQQSGGQGGAASQEGGGQSHTQVEQGNGQAQVSTQKAPATTQSGDQQSTSKHSNVPARPAPCKLGGPFMLSVNAFLVTQMNSKPVYQYDITIDNGAEKRGLIRRVWDSNTVQKELGEIFIFDGHKLAWSGRKIEKELRISVDLDVDEDCEPHEGKGNKHVIVIRPTHQIKFDTLHSYLAHRCDFDKSILEAITFFDHMLRETPSKKLTSIKRSFFAPEDKRTSLGRGVEAYRGVYQSLRIIHSSRQNARLAILVDVSNGTFWTSQRLIEAAREVLDEQSLNHLVNTMTRMGGENSRAVMLRQKLRRLHVTCQHRGKDVTDEYVVDRVLTQGARQYKFMKDGKDISVFDYFMQAYGIRLQWPDLPLVKMTGANGPVLPMEVLTIKPHQRYMFKLDEKQTRAMIDFAVTYPMKRSEAIRDGVEKLDWANDPVLKHFGVKIQTGQMLEEARQLMAPRVKFNGSEEDPRDKGRWNLKDRRFIHNNARQPLKTWGVCIFTGRFNPNKPVVEHFVRKFVDAYVGHGGVVHERNPFITVHRGNDWEAGVQRTWNDTGNHFKQTPQLLFFVLPEKNAEIYGSIKRKCDCQYGVPTQCVQYQHVQKALEQYISNVCMKVNAKLGGATSLAVNNTNTNLVKPGTAIIGADVSHAAPGSTTPSMAAITCSADIYASRYWGLAETNGFRQEIISPDNIHTVFGELIRAWIHGVNNNQPPSTILYIRDGVSEGQYQYILSHEVAGMKNFMTDYLTQNGHLRHGQAPLPNFVVIIGSKRHHVRFFPGPAGDNNCNPKPGALLDTGVTHPYENDFYLCSHAAIKGTARPVHYCVLMNESGYSNEELQTLLFEHCYMYVRSTTPVSQHPAVYYAHVVSNRAIPHYPLWRESLRGESSSGRGTEEGDGGYDCG
ncbi:Piwi-domain-containing protein [Piedraia hortae CBS 480.64]|uniref:Piwi-domain-containing protein n=1 Tax=Piedraia hortae CBS 480.64 TaxID=1314780 RepID=A0A6A7BVH1_9PEZI|nr:Piwi-domain-containing protein [Piedraia hortae CBS 480.64]